MKAIQILKELLPPTDYIVPVSVRKKIEEAIASMEDYNSVRDNTVLELQERVIALQAELLTLKTSQIPPEIRFRKLADMYSVVQAVAPLLPTNKPRYLMGVDSYEKTKVF